MDLANSDHKIPVTIAGLKKKENAEYDNDMSSDEEILSQALPTANFTEYDETMPPLNGMEYLRRVQLEAKTLPKVVVSDIKGERYNSNQNIFAITNSPRKPYNSYAKIPKISSLTLSSRAWQKEELEQFLRLRSSLIDMRTRSHSMLDTSPNDRSQDTSSNSHNWRSLFSSTKPTTDLVLFLQQKDVICGLETATNLLADIKNFTFTHDLGRWIYILLTSLEKPLSGDVHDTLRKLVLSLMEHQHLIYQQNIERLELIRKILLSSSDNEKGEMAELVSPSNFEKPELLIYGIDLIICIVAKYFDQLDFLDVFSTSVDS